VAAAGSLPFDSSKYRLLIRALTWYAAVSNPPRLRLYAVIGFMDSSARITLFRHLRLVHRRLPLFHALFTDVLSRSV
jgi:hypothetical protein